MEPVLLLALYAVCFGCAQGSGMFGSLATMEAFVEHHNSRSDVGWKATTENFKHIPAEKLLDHAKLLCGSRASPIGTETLKVKTYVAPVIPKEFDSRKKWPFCPSIKDIRDQGNCGSCWAFGCVEAATDRICISSQGKIQAHLSAEDLLACCDRCGGGCNGGFSTKAWTYLWRQGVVTGGHYNSSKGCLPYEVEACEHHARGPLKQCDGTEKVPTPECHRQCRSGYNTTFKADKHFGKEPYLVFGEEPMQTEIMTHGPVEALLYIYADFLFYKSGVYQHSPKAKGIGGHAVKLLGWGVEDGRKYWLAANSWNHNWGDNGFFKILRGAGESGIEHKCTAAIMDV